MAEWLCYMQFVGSSILSSRTSEKIMELKPGACSNCFDIPCRCGKAYEDIPINKLVQAKNAIDKVIKRKEKPEHIPDETIPTLNVMTEKLKAWREKRNKSA